MEIDILKICEFVKDGLLEKLESNLKVLCMFGTGNNVIDELSDVDFFVLLEKMDVSSLKNVALIRETAKEKFKIQVDIHTYLFEEYEHSLNSQTTFFFFNGWALYAINKGYQKIIYSYPEFKINPNININIIKKDALRRANHYINRLRELFHSNTILVRGEQKALQNNEFLKICTSGLKCILIFLLANKSIFVFSLSETLIEAKKYFDISEIEKAINLRKTKTFDYEILSKSYEQAERLYKKEINKNNT